MIIHFKITKELLEQIHNDLSRPHPFASERAGFLFTKYGTAYKKTVIIISSLYVPIPDDNYIDDPSVGASIGSSAIRNAMQQSIDSNMGVLHVHMHQQKGYPYFSHIDKKSLYRLMPSFFNINPDIPHGALLLSTNYIAGTIWLNKGEQINISRVSIIGYPCTFVKYDKHVI